MKTLAGFDIGGTKCAVIAGVLTGTKQPEILCKKQFATADHPDPLDCVTHLLEILQEMRQTHSDWEMESLGISCGGPLDPIQGIIQSPPNLPGWDNIPITQICEAKLGIPARLQNDANACALAEWRFGAGQGCSNMIFLGGCVNSFGLDFWVLRWHIIPLPRRANETYEYIETAECRHERYKRRQYADSAGRDIF